MATTTYPKAATAPTSDLPFTELACDVPCLDAIKNRRHHWLEKLYQKRGGDSAPDAAFARDEALFADRVDQVQTLLAVMEDYFEAARRGGTPGGAGAGVCFDRAMSLLGLARELVENAGIEAEAALETFCNATD